MPGLTHGFFITIEGIEGVGKSTLCRLLAARMQEDGYTVTATRQPGSPQLSGMIRSCITASAEPLSPLTLMLLFSADRREHLATCVKPALQAGHVVICDRMADSTYAYQGFGAGVDRSLIQAVTDAVVEDCMPSLTMYVRLPVEQALARVKARAEDASCFDKADVLQRVEEGFDALYKQRNDVIVVDGTPLPDQVAAAAYSALSEHPRWQAYQARRN
jgi:dTMP kinase